MLQFSGPIWVMKIETKVNGNSTYNKHSVCGIAEHFSEDLHKANYPG